MRQEKIGRYEVLETLARGGMGVVYKARDPLIDRIVAVKTLGFGLSPIEAEAFHKRFAREAKSAGRLSHPNIVTIHDMGESDDGAYIAMEFLEGRTLRDILDSGVVLPPARIADIIVQVADGLAFAHQNDVIHCDIKPANIMVLENGAVKIMDFGIARLPTGSRTFAGNVLGSPRYISPEQIVGRPVDARSDVFALGAVLYETLTGVPPFAGSAIDEILYQVVNEKPQPPSERNRALPAGFDEIVARAMAKHADDRYQRVSDFAAALRKLDLAPVNSPMTLPPLPVAPGTTAARPASSPGAATVQLDEASATPDAARARARRRILVAAPAVLLVALAAWKLLAPGGADVEDRPPVTRSATTAGTAAIVTPRPAAEITVIPPLNARSSAAAAAPPPVVESNTIAAPSPLPQTVAVVPLGGGIGRLGFAISPWGEVYVDGRKQGVTPPMTELKLPAGRYTVEIRNAGFAPYAQTVDLGADATLRIKHKFK